MVQGVVETWQFTQSNKVDLSGVLFLHVHAPDNHNPSSKFMDDPRVPLTTPGQGLLIATDAKVSRVLLGRVMQRSSRGTSVVLHCLGNTNVTRGILNSRICRLRV